MAFLINKIKNNFYLAHYTDFIRQLNLDSVLDYHSIPEEYRHRGLKSSQHKIPIPNVESGECVDISVEFTAPMYPGTMISYWKMVDDKGKLCFPDHDGLSCLVQVVAI